MMRAALLALIAATGAASLAFAAARDQVDGAWQFKTGPFDSGCVLSGRLVVGAKQKSGAHFCQIEAREVCPLIKRAGQQPLPALDITAGESCVLTEQNGRVTIVSKVVRAPTQPYLPDNFNLQVRNVSRMEGDFLSTEVLSKAVFFRGPDVIS